MGYNATGYVPEQGDIILINFNPSVGREIQKRRPALVISGTKYNVVTGFVAVCPITNTKKTHFVPLNESHKTHGYINALQVKTLDYSNAQREVRFLEKATLAELGQAAQIVNMIFNFSDLLGE